MTFCINSLSSPASFNTLNRWGWQTKRGVENYRSLEAKAWVPVQAGQGRQWQPCPRIASHSQSRSRSCSANLDFRFVGRFVDIQPGCPCSRHKQRACSASRVSCKSSETPSGRSCPSRGAASRCGSPFLVIIVVGFSSDKIAHLPH